MIWFVLHLLEYKIPLPCSIAHPGMLTGFVRTSGKQIELPPVWFSIETAKACEYSIIKG
jgi:hypothetical protein